MTREEAIAYGKRVIDLGLNDETQAFCELAIEALKKEPKWIPITERLPEVEMATRCLVTVDGCGIDDFTAIRSYFPDTKDFNDIVTAWMPLPEPYKAESENT